MGYDGGSHPHYVARENHFGANVLVTRKGAVHAGEGDLDIIPGSMGCMNRRRLFQRRLFWWRFGRFLRWTTRRNARNRLRRRFCRRLGYLGLEHGTSIEISRMVSPCRDRYLLSRAVYFKLTTSLVAVVASFVVTTVGFRHRKTENTSP